MRIIVSIVAGIAASVFFGGITQIVADSFLPSFIAFAMGGAFSGLAYVRVTQKAAGVYYHRSRILVMVVGVAIAGVGLLGSLSVGEVGPIVAAIVMAVFVYGATDRTGSIEETSNNQL